MKKQPHVYIIAGSNGSGKTTFALEYLPILYDRILNKVKGSPSRSGKMGKLK